MNTMVIGIAGGTGSGKTTVTEKLQEYFGADVSVLHHDSYYKRHDELPFEKRKLLNYDQSILDIVMSEAQAYFAGQKSADEVARLVQSKVNIYVNEQR